jgi:hypothetical protein
VSSSYTNNFYHALNQLGTLIDLIDNWKNELSAESLSNQLDLQNHEWFTELQNKYTYLACQYSKDLNGFELYQGYKDDIISLKTAKQNGEKLDFFPKVLLKYVSSAGLEASKTLAAAFSDSADITNFNNVM